MTLRLDELRTSNDSASPPRQRREYCTYFDHRYLAKALTLHRSLERHASPFRLFVLALDEECASALDELQLDDVVVTRLAELERADAELLAVKNTRSTAEYYFTSTPAWMRYVLGRWPDIGLLTYLDADLAFFSDPQPLYGELDGSSIGIVPHRFPEALRHLERYGRYNVSWVSIRRDESGLGCLDWWRERCLEWCYDREEEGKFADQKYLDDWPERFSSVHVVRHPGADLAPWNVASHDLTAGEDAPLVDGQPLIFLHAHRFDLVEGESYEAHLDDYGVELTAALDDLVFGPYARQLAAAGRDLAACGAGVAGAAADEGTIRTSSLIALRDSVRSSRGEAEAARNELADAESRIAALREQVERREAELARREAEIVRLSTELSRQANALSAGEAELARLAATVRGYEQLRIDWALERMRRIDEVRSLESKLAELVSSRSWRMTEPLRRFMEWTRGAGSGAR